MIIIRIMFGLLFNLYIFLNYLLQQLFLERDPKIGTEIAHSNTCNPMRTGPFCVLQSQDVTQILL